MTHRCPTCHQPIQPPKANGRQCFDCKRPILLHDKWAWVERQGIQTCAHRHCDNPQSYFAKGEEPIAPAPLFEGAAA